MFSNILAVFFKNETSFGAGYLPVIVSEYLLLFLLPTLCGYSGISDYLLW
jgi:hypothetical protein